MRWTWRAFGFVLTFMVVSLAGFAQEDRQGCEDYPLVTRIKGFYIEGCKDEAFATHKFQTDKSPVEIEGHFRSISYRLPKTLPEMSGVEMIRNYTNAIQAIGGEVKYEGRYSGTTRVVVDGREVWMDIEPYGKRAYRLSIIERQAMKQQVVADAEALAADLDRSGHVVLAGIYFDTDKAVIRPESETALAEITKFLTTNPKLEAFVVGHTDMSGSLEHNVQLSEERAAAVVAALVKDHGIAAGRLTPRGIGPLAPVASNDSADGRALNRRVELVNK